MLGDLILRVSGDGTGGYVSGAHWSAPVSHNITERFWINSMGSGWIPDLPQQMLEVLTQMDPFQHHERTDWGSLAPLPEFQSKAIPTYEDLGDLWDGEQE